MMVAWIAVPMALCVLFAIGYASVTLAGGRLRLLWYERWALAWLLGCGVATVTWFLLMPLYRWISPIVIVTGFAATLALAAGLRQKLAPERFDDPFLQRPVDNGSRNPFAAMFGGSGGDAVLTAILLVQFAALGMAAVRTPLGWDGLFNFEMKARLAFEHTPSGQLPASYFADATRSWSHQRYPLLVPFTEFWLYSWLGHVNQSVVKIVFPLFYVSLAALVCGAVRRLANSRAALITAIALGFVPAITLLPGAASGYADVPLAASVAGAACFTFLALRTGEPRYVTVAALLLAVAVWTKAEGVILAGAIGVSAIGAAGNVGRRQLSALLWLPALALVPWYLALEFHGATTADDFRPVSVTALSGAIDTFVLVGPLVARELIRPGHWGMVWPAFFTSAVLMAVSRRSTRADWFLVVSVLISMSVYSLVYTLSSWPDVAEHVGFSLSRLLTPLAPVAMFFVARRAVDDLGIERVEWA